MKSKSISNATLDELLEEFAGCSVLHNELLDANPIDQRKVNRNVKRIFDLAREMEARGDVYQSLLRTLLSDTRPSVRLSATAFSEKLMPAETLSVLEELTKHGGQIGFTAEWRLRDLRPK